MSDPPTEGQQPTPEVLTFLFADVRGYTRFTQERGDEAAARLAAKFAVVTREGVRQAGGTVVELRGDGALVVFNSARGALRAAIDLQRSFARESDELLLPLKVGMGLDAGEAIPVEGGYRGGALNLAARLSDLAGPGEVLATEALIHLARKMDDVEYLERGRLQLKGFPDPVPVLEVVPTGNDHRQPAEPDEDEQQDPSMPIGGFLGALPASDLVARDEELERVLEALRRVEGGTGQLVLLTGEPGIGKTRLAQEATLKARNQGFRVITGSCFEPQKAVPFYPFLEALAMAYATAPSGVRSNVVSRWSQLGKLIPNEQIPPASAPPSDAREEHQKLFWGVTGLLQAIAEREPLALLLDDLQWADGSSIDLLQHLARHTRANRVLILGTYRDVEVDRDHSLGRAILDLERQRLVERIPLRRLPDEGTAALIAATIGLPQVSPDFVDMLHRQTEGNPFFIQQMLRGLVEQGDVFRENGHWDHLHVDRIEVPETILAVIGQRVSRLGDDAQRFLQQASVLGPSFSFEDLLSMTSHIGDQGAESADMEDELEEALEEAARAGLIREASGETYAFNHTLTQHALYSELTSRRRRRLHVAAGFALERLPEDARRQRAGELAEHFLRAGESERALPYLILVADRAEGAFAHADARTYYNIALDVSSQLSDQQQEAEIREKLGGLLTATIDYPAALTMLEQSAQLYRSTGNAEAEVRVIAQIGRVHFAQATAEDGINRVRSTLESIHAAGDSNLSAGSIAALHSVLASLLFARDRYQESLSEADQAASLAQPAGVKGVLAEARVRRGSALAMLGEWQESLQVLIEATDSAEQSGDLFSFCRGLQYLSGVYLAMGDLDVSRSLMQRALDVAQRMDNRRQIATTTFGLALTAFMRGDRSRATSLSEQALEIMEDLGGFWLSVLQSAGLSLSLSYGEWQAAPQPLRECLDLVERNGELPLLRSERLEAEKDLLQGRAHEALARLRPSLDSPGLDEQKRTGLMALAAWAHMETDREALAEKWISDGLRRAESQNLNLSLAVWQRLRGMLLFRQGEFNSAPDALNESVAIAQRSSYPYAEARSLYELGVVYARRGLPHQAKPALSQSLMIFERLGAKIDADRAERLLATK